MKIFLLTIALLASTLGASEHEAKIKEMDRFWGHVDQKYRKLVKLSEQENNIPRTLDKEGKLKFVTNKYLDWTSGFYPGALWYLYEKTGGEFYKQAAEKSTGLLEKHQYVTDNHDTGFVMNCSYGNQMRLSGDEDGEIARILVQTSDSLLTRYNARVGSIRSWDVNAGWQSKRGWKFPVIIDNMMNLEMLFNASLLSKDLSYASRAIAHANTTLENHFRVDGSCVHVVDYDPESGEVRGKVTAQGFDHASAWARGQAWALYGYTMCYRYTGEEKYLKKAHSVANYILTHPRLPEDLVPYWDFDDRDIPNTYRDASSASIYASALVELATYSDKLDADRYIESAWKMIKSLSSQKYTASLDSPNPFVLNLKRLIEIGVIKGVDDAPRGFRKISWDSFIKIYKEAYKR